MSLLGNGLLSSLEHYYTVFSTYVYPSYAIVVVKGFRWLHACQLQSDYQENQ